MVCWEPAARAERDAGMQGWRGFVPFFCLAKRWESCMWSPWDWKNSLERRGSSYTWCTHVVLPGTLSGNGKKKANQTVQQTLISASKRASCCPALGTTPRPLGMEVERFWLESQQENRPQAGVEHSSGAVLYPQAQLQEPSCMPAQLSPSPSRTESQQADVCSTGRPWGKALQKGSTPPQLHKQGCKAGRGTSRGTAAPPCSWPWPGALPAPPHPDLHKVPPARGADPTAIRPSPMQGAPHALTSQLLLLLKQRKIPLALSCTFWVNFHSFPLPPPFPWQHWPCMRSAAGCSKLWWRCRRGAKLLKSGSKAESAEVGWITHL